MLQAARADTVRALFVLLNLLECQPKRFCDFFLRDIEHEAPHTQAGANVFVGWIYLCARSSAGPVYRALRYNDAGPMAQDKLSCCRLLSERFPSRGR